MQTIKYELNIALVPEKDLANKHTAASQGLAAHYPAVIQLGSVEPRLAFAPHLTLYQVAVVHDSLAEIFPALEQLASETEAPTLAATTYAYNAGEASFELRYEAPAHLVALQKSLINIVNLQRGGLLIEKDPGGNDVSSLSEADGTLGENIRATGFAEVGDPAEGGLFRPHVTLNWFAPGTSAETNHPSLPAADTLGGTYTHLGIYLLGPYGTCAQRLALYALSGRSA
jgi:hypothetical protein